MVGNRRRFLGIAALAITAKRGHAEEPFDTLPDGVTVYAYNTGTQGYYGENRAEYPPRLYGWMKTDAGGRFELRTILPGSYPGMRVPAHIHFSFWGAGYPLQWVDELRFEGGRYITPAMLSQDAEAGESRTIRRLARGEDGVLHCGHRIRLQRRSNFR